jgi:hypothetical protein
MNAGPERQGSHWRSRRQYRARCVTVEHWSLTSLREKLVKIGAKIVTHARDVTFQMAEVAVPRDLFREILRLIDRLRVQPTPA